MGTRIRLRFKGEKEPNLTDFYNFIHDLEILYDMIVIHTEESYINHKLPKSYPYYFRRGSLLYQKDRLRLQKLNQENPLEIFVIAGCVAAASTFVIMLATLYQIPLKRKNLKLDIKHKEILIDTAKIKKEKRIEELKIAIDKRRNGKIYRRNLHHLRESMYKLMSIGSDDDYN